MTPEEIKDDRLLLERFRVTDDPDMRRNDVAERWAAALDGVERLNTLAKEAIAELEDWSSYASDYFKEKHDLEGRVNGLKERLT